MPDEDGSVHMREAPGDDSHTDFGFKKVKLGLKTGLVGDLFAAVALKYDLMNDCMSLGAHRFWKRDFIKRIRLAPNARALDLAGGTGDIAIGLFEAKRYLAPRIIACDLTEAMLREGRRKAYDKGITEIDWHVGNAEKLPYPDNGFDAVSIAFGLRNVADKPKAIREMARILKPNGKLYCLEFSKARSLVKPLYDAYSFKILPKIGEYVAGNGAAYRYLVESIRTFPDADTLREMFLENGFSACVFEKKSIGLVAVHTCVK